MISILPPNATFQEKILESVLTRREKLISDSAVGFEISRLFDPDAYSDRRLETFLPFLAWGLGINVWDPSWGIQTKIDFLKAFIEIKYIGGTKTALEKAYRALGFNETVVTESKNEPFTFYVNFFETVSAKDRKLIEEITETFKPARSGFAIKLNFKAIGYVGVFSIMKLSKIKRFRG